VRDLVTMEWLGRAMISDLGAIAEGSVTETREDSPEEGELALQKFPYFWTVLNRPKLVKNCQESIPDDLKPSGI
jgi:hypothetical protein